jgi:hypothetical protein
MADGTKTASASALSFWAEPAERPGDRPWREWRRNLEDIRAGLDEYWAGAAESDARLAAMKADAEARIAFHEAETARLQIAAEIAHATAERSLHQLLGG